MNRGYAVFISYRRSDLDWVVAFDAALRARGIPTWLDKRDIPVSVSWLDEARDAIEAADLVVVCDSDAWRSSLACKVEKATADDFSKALTLVNVGVPLDEAVELVVSELTMISRSARVANELSVRARDWDRSGRRSSDLASTPELNSYPMRAPAGSRAAVVSSFLAASRRRARRKKRVAVAIAIAVAVAILSYTVTSTLKSEIDVGNEQQAANYALTNNDVIVANRMPYEGLRRAAARGANESAIDSMVIEVALSKLVPDDAFSVPGSTAGFSHRPVTDIVQVHDAAGLEWERKVDATDVRNATPSTTQVGNSASSPWSARAHQDSAVVELDREGSLYRTFVADAPVRAVAVSPDGRLIAASVKGEVDVFLVGTGQRFITTWGAPGDITDLAWSSDGLRLWATTTVGVVVAWTIEAARVVADDPARDFEAIFRTPNPAEAWALTHDGSLLLIDLLSGAIKNTIRVPETAFYGAVNTRGDRAVVIGAHEQWIVDLSRSTSTGFPLNGCNARRPAFDRDDGRVFVPCQGGAVVVIATDDGHELQRIAVADSGAESVLVAPKSGDVYIGDLAGNLFQLDSDRHDLVHLDQSRCKAAFVRIAISDDEQNLIPVGYNTNGIGCSIRGTRDGTEWRWNAGASNQDLESAYSQSVTYIADGDEYAIGYGDGSIVIRPTENLSPEEVQHVAGPIRDLLSEPMEHRMLAVTSNGLIVSFDVRPERLSNANRAAEARRRLQRAIDLGMDR